MYHYISAPPLRADAIRLDLSVPPERFEAHLRYLQDQGYTTVALHDLALALQIGHPLPKKPLILTLDDGYRDNYVNAFPLLLKYGFSGTFFLVTAYIDQGHPQYVTWDQVVEMDAGGMEMGAHGHTHVDLRGRSVDYLVWQILGAKEAIEARTEKPVRFFCYPSGKYDHVAIKVLRSANYWGALTVSEGAEHWSDRMFTLERIRVHGHYEVSDLACAIETFMAGTQESPPCTMTP